MFCHRLPTLSIAVAAAICFASPGLASEGDRPDLTVAVQAIPDSLTPCGPTRNITYRTVFNIFDMMIGRDYLNNYKLQPALATNWKRVDDRTVDLTLREGVLFHDGTPMTAEDVAFSFGPERMLSDDAPCRPVSRQFVGNLEKVEILDDHTVRFISSTADPILEQRLGSWMSQVVSKKAFEAADSFDSWSMAPVGTGPYKVKSFSPGRYLELEGFDDYWGGKPPFHILRFEAVPEPAARIAGLVAGDYGLATEIAPDQFESVEAYDSLDIIGGIVGNTRLIRYDTRDPVMKDPRIRRALGLAIDRDLIVNELWHGRTKVMNGFQFPFYGDMYLKDYPKPVYDPEKARALVKEAEYDGTPIPFTVYAGYYTNDLATSEILQAMWADVGLNVKIELVNGWGEINAEGAINMSNTSSTMVVPDPVGDMWRSFGPNTRSVQGLGRWANKEFNELGQVLQTNMDLETRRDAFRKMMDIFFTEDPEATLLHANAMFYAKAKDVPFEAYPTPYMDFGPRNPAVK